MDIISNRLYTLDEVSEYLKISYRNTLQLVHLKKLKSIKIGNMYRVYGSDLNKFLKLNIY